MSTQVLMGSIIVPSLILLFFFVRYVKYLMLKRRCSEAITFGELYVAYLLVFRAYQRPGSRYISLLLFMTERLKYELDRLTEFEKPTTKGFDPLWRRSFLAQFSIAHTALFGVSMETNTGKISFSEKFAGSRTPMDSLIESRLFELYQKQALLLLRKGGFLPFMIFLYRNKDKFKQYAEEIPFAVLGRDSWIPEIVFPISDEISERLMNFFKNCKKISSKGVEVFLIFDKTFMTYFPEPVQKEAAVFKGAIISRKGGDVRKSR